MKKLGFWKELVVLFLLGAIFPSLVEFTSGFFGIGQFQLIVLILLWGWLIGSKSKQANLGAKTSILLGFLGGVAMLVSSYAGSLFRDFIFNEIILKRYIFVTIAPDFLFYLISAFIVAALSLISYRLTNSKKSSK